MKLQPRKLATAVLGPAPVSRERAIGISERLAAAGAVTASLEQLSRRDSFRRGGLHDWTVERDINTTSAPLTRRLLDALGDDRATTALHAARAAAGAALLLPGSGRWRGGVNAFLGLSNVALNARHRFGNDGADQVTTLVQTACGLARMARKPELQDALLWYVALQTNLSYAVSGWVKLLGRDWRSGAALGGVLRTKTYGHEGAWKLTQRYPVPARYLAHGVLALECLFPLVYARGGALAKPIIGSAAAFHAANGYLMGLGRFITAFTSMHPMVAYTSAPKTHAAVAGRDDRLPTAALAMGATAVAGAAALTAARRLRAAEAPEGSRTVTTRHGNRLSYNARRAAGREGPVVVFLTGMTSTVEHFGWVADTVAEEHDVLTYSRAGYGPSQHRDRPGAQHRGGRRRFTLGESVDDLVDLVRAAVPQGRRVLLVGHSLGGEIARRAAGELGEGLLGVVYLDSSHPGELHRSAHQGAKTEALRSGLNSFLVSLRAGLGGLVARPAWVESLPRRHRDRAFAQYADGRMWRASLREWDATEREFRAFGGAALPSTPGHALVVSAQRTVDGDPEHLLMHQELADAHRDGTATVRSSVVEGADHDSLLTDARLGTETGRRILAFLSEVVPHDAHTHRTAQEAR